MNSDEQPQNMPTSEDVNNQAQSVPSVEPAMPEQPQDAPTPPAVPATNEPVTEPVAAPVGSEPAAASQPVASEMPQAPVAATPAAPNLHEIFDQIAEKIIEQQEAIIGPVAVEQAKQVHELTVNWPQHDVDIQGNPQQAIDELVEQYKELFGQIAVETCKEAAARYLAQLPADQLPNSLK